jgi:hypothetical protein
LPRDLGKQAQILKLPISLKDVFKDEIVEFNNKESREKEAVKEIEKQRAKKKAIRRREIITSKMEELNKETIHELGDLLVYTRAPRMLITSKSVIYQSLTLCTNNSKYLH